MTGLDSSLGCTAHMVHDALVYSTVKAAARPCLRQAGAALQNYFSSRIQMLR